MVSAILNARPLSLRVAADGEYHALAPRDVLFGRAGRSLAAASKALDFSLNLDQDSVLASMSSQQARIVEAWRAKWKEAVFPDMVARPKWRSAVRNLRPGDIGHVRYQKSVGQHEWRLAMVEKAPEDDDGTVRTVVVAFRPRHKKDSGKPYVSKTAQRLEIGVQRFAVLMAEEELKSLEDGEGPPAGPSGVRDDVKLGGLGLYAVLGRRNRTALDSPSPPLLHEVKLPGLVAGGCIVRLRQEGKLALLHEVKLFGPGTGGPVWCRLRQEGKLALLHEVKLFTSQVDQEKTPQRHLYHRSSRSSTTYTTVFKKYLSLAKEYPDFTNY